MVFSGSFSGDDAVSELQLFFAGLHELPKPLVGDGGVRAVDFDQICTTT